MIYKYRRKILRNSKISVYYYDIIKSSVINIHGLVIKRKYNNGHCFFRLCTLSGKCDVMYNFNTLSSVFLFYRLF